MESFPEVIEASCDFCHELGGGVPRLSELPAATVARRVFRSQAADIHVLADASPILPGHALLVPARHVSRFSLCDHRSLDVVIDEFRKRLRGGAKLVFFEHGGFSCLRDGACSEHAHVHTVIVPGMSMRDLSRRIRQRGGTCSERYDSLGAFYGRALAVDRPNYLMLGIATAKSMEVREVRFDPVESQILRTVLAECLGIQPHIRDLQERAASFVATCEGLRKYSPVARTVAVDDVGEPERIETKEECFDCQYDCVRRVTRARIAVPG
jgi:diadenosine tetraphosphate (Ap4A) HIT family hydrolase